MILVIEILHERCVLRRRDHALSMPRRPVHGPLSSSAPTLTRESVDTLLRGGHFRAILAIERDLGDLTVMERTYVIRTGVARVSREIVDDALAVARVDAAGVVVLLGVWDAVVIKRSDIDRLLGG